MRSQSVDEIFTALADERRRTVVRYLLDDADGVASYRDVARHVASRCSDHPEDVTVALRHAILPALADAGILRYDPDSELIRYRPNDLVEHALAVVAEGK